MGRSDRHSTALASHARAGVGVGLDRRAGVHRRDRVLRVRPPDPIRPFGLACFRARRYSLSLLRSAVVRGLTAYEPGRFAESHLEEAGGRYDARRRCYRVTGAATLTLDLYYPLMRRAWRGYPRSSRDRLF